MISWARVWEKNARRLEDVYSGVVSRLACMSFIHIAPIARGRRRAMGSTSIDGDGVVDEEEGPSMMDGRGLGDDDAEARLEELEDVEESAAMLARYINALDTSDLYVGDEVLSSDNLSSDDEE